MQRYWSARLANVLLLRHLENPSLSQSQQVHACRCQLPNDKLMSLGSCLVHWQGTSKAGVNAIRPKNHHAICSGIQVFHYSTPPPYIHTFHIILHRHQNQAVRAAGEEGGPEYVWEAIRDLKVQRVDHGIHSLEDEELVQYMVEHQLPITLCPLSNLHLKVRHSLSSPGALSMLG